MQLLDANGGLAGELATTGPFRTEKALLRDGRPVLQASTVGWSSKGFEIRSGPVRVASVSVHRPPLRLQWDARGVTLRFSPVASPVPRSLLVAFASLLALGKTPPAWLAFDEP